MYGQHQDDQTRLGWEIGQSKEKKTHNSLYIETTVGLEPDRKISLLLELEPEFEINIYPGCISILQLELEPGRGLYT